VNDANARFDPAAIARMSRFSNTELFRSGDGNIDHATSNGCCS
jgi:hypothetical protein